MQSKMGILPEVEFYRKLDKVLPGGIYEQARKDPKRRIYFTRISIEGLEEMHAYSIDERLYKYFEFEPFKTISDTEKYLKKLIDIEGDKISGRTAIAWFVRRIKDKKLVGTSRLVNLDYNRQSVEWGYGIDPQLWGDGHILEIQEVLKKYIFITLQMNRLFGQTRVDNKPTISSLLATGIKNEGVHRQALRDSKGVYHDTWMYSLVADEFYENKKYLDEKKTKKQINKKTIAEIIAKELNDNSVNENTDMGSISSWDSLSHIRVILTIEKAIGFSLTPKEIAQATSVENLHHIINNSN